MAFIKCPDCKQLVSNTAQSCPLCGHDFTPAFQKLGKKVALGGCGVMGCGCFLVVLFIVMVLIIGYGYSQ